MWKLGTLVGLLLMASPALGQEVYRNVTSEKVEALLKELNISARKVGGKGDGIVYYHFKQDNFEIRLHNYGGKDLWIDCIFTDKLTPDMVNRWNVRAKSSRAVFIRDGAQETVSLESQIDCMGGVTDAIIKRFVVRFNGELSDFSRFITK
jgi:hypothetical protein